MTIQSKAQPTPNPTPLAASSIMTKIPHLFCTVTVSLFLFIGVAHAQGPCPPNTPNCILVSDRNGVTVWSDDGRMELNMGLTSDGGGGEGITCISGSTNVLYIAGGAGVSAYSMNLVNNKATLLGPPVAGCGGSTTGIAADGSGMLLYEAGYGFPGCVSSLTPLPASPWLQLNSGQNTNTADALHDIALGICAPGTSCGYGGNVFTSYSQNDNAGVIEYSPNLNLGQTLPLLGQFLPAAPNNCAYFGAAVGTRCWSRLSGMAFDSQGNLWANSPEEAGDGTFEFAPGGTCGTPLCPLNFTLDGTGTTNEPIGLTVAPSTDPLHPGKILIANVGGGTINIIDPTSCTGLHPSGSPWTPGTCTESGFITDTGASPKYVVYNHGCPNPDNNGDVEICKHGNSQLGPGPYGFTVTAPLFSTGTLQIPLGECSGSIQVPAAIPNGTVTITETPTIGDLVSNVTAYSYNQLGQYVNELPAGGWTEPDLYANVNVVPGDISLETEAIFTNYAAQPGQLKICKIAGPGVPVGTPFYFFYGPFWQDEITVEAGPPDQGGYCALGPTFNANTPLTISEVSRPPYQVSNITVSCNACTYNINLAKSSVTTTIGAGITEVDFTNFQPSGIR